MCIACGTSRFFQSGASRRLKSSPLPLLNLVRLRNYVIPISLCLTFPKKHAAYSPLRAASTGCRRRAQLPQGHNLFDLRAAGYPPRLRPLQLQSVQTLDSECRTASTPSFSNLCRLSFVTCCNWDAQTLSSFVRLLSRGSNSKSFISSRLASMMAMTGPKISVSKAVMPLAASGSRQALALSLS